MAEIHNYDNWTVPRLKAEAIRRDFQNISRMRKADLVALLSIDDPVVDNPTINLLRMFVSGNINIDTVRRLIDEGANVNATDGDRMTPLHHAPVTNQLDVAALLIERGANVNLVDFDGTTALHFAAYYNTPEIMEALLNSGADIDAIDRLGSTPLMIAVINEWKEIVTFLVNKGANVNIVDVKGETSLHFAAYDSDLMELLLEAGANIDAADQYGNTVLMAAVKKRNPVGVKMLIERGANIELRNSDGKIARDLYKGSGRRRQFDKFVEEHAGGRLIKAA